MILLQIAALLQNAVYQVDNTLAKRVLKMLDDVTDGCGSYANEFDIENLEKKKATFIAFRCLPICRVHSVFHESC